VVEADYPFESAHSAIDEEWAHEAESGWREAP
jgi:hypothetical protein